MNTKSIAKGLLFGASLLLASAAFAGEKATVKVYEDVKVNGKTLPAGKYDLSWEGTGSNVQVNIRQGKETVATLPAQVEASKSASSSPAKNMFSISTSRPPELPHNLRQRQATSKSPNWAQGFAPTLSANRSLNVLASLRVRGRFLFA